MAKASELRAKDVAALEIEIKDLLKSHFNLRMQRATQQLNDHSAMKKTRRDIARVKTILAEKKGAAQ
ncbi:MAG: 50S ribosomal protein L29 [Aquabacterium sp.]|jgi:large subunit ribosomal protein L29|nr:50S ribosomal protein L29 [Aquabacterium sp.]